MPRKSCVPRGPPCDRRAPDRARLAAPTGEDEFRTRHGEIIAGVQLDELYQGTALASRERFLAWFAEAGLPSPTSIDLPSGAAVFVAERAD